MPQDRTVRVYDRHGNRVFTIDSEKYYNHLTFSGDGKYLIASDRNTVQAFSSIDGNPILSYPTEGVEHLVSDGRFIVNSRGKHIDVYEIISDNHTKLCGHEETITSLWIRPNSSMMLSTSMDCTIRIWNLETCKCMKIFKFREPASSAVIDEHSGLLISAHRDESRKDTYSQINISDITGRNDCRSLLLTENIWRICSLAYDRDNNYCIIEDISGIYVHELESGLRVFSLDDCGLFSTKDGKLDQITVVKNGYML